MASGLQIPESRAHGYCSASDAGSVWPVFWAILGVLAFVLAVQFGMTSTEWFSRDIYQLYGDQITVSSYALILLAGLPFSTLVSSLTGFGQELGWRGFLASALAPLGFWQSALLTGVIAGIWYSPLIMLGYNFDRTEAWSSSPVHRLQRVCLSPARRRAKFRLRADDCSIRSS